MSEQTVNDVIQTILTDETGNKIKRVDVTDYTFMSAAVLHSHEQKIKSQLENHIKECKTRKLCCGNAYGYLGKLDNKEYIMMELENEAKDEPSWLSKKDIKLMNYKEGADLGSPFAMYHYADGAFGTGVNPMPYFEKARDAGNHDAMFMYAKCLYTNDLKLTEEMYQKLESVGNPTYLWSYARYCQWMAGTRYKDLDSKYNQKAIELCKKIYIEHVKPHFPYYNNAFKLQKMISEIYWEDGNSFFMDLFCEKHDMLNKQPTKKTQIIKLVFL